MLPTWLSPTQVRDPVPVAERHLPFAKEIADRLNAARVRTDFDDRDESVGKKIRESGMDWDPYVVVVGDAEVESGNRRADGDGRERNQRKTSLVKISLTEQELITVVGRECGDMPWRPLYTPRQLSKKARYI